MNMMAANNLKKILEFDGVMLNLHPQSDCEVDPSVGGLGSLNF